MNSPPTGIGEGPPVKIPHDAPPTQAQRQAILIWTIGAFCIYGWELLICLPKEYRLIWKRPLNFSSILYLANRYYGLLQFIMIVTLATDVWTPSACKRIFYFEPIGALVSIVLSQMVLGGRVYALFSQNKALGLVFGLLFVAEITVGGIAISHITPPPSLAGIPGLPADFQPPPCGALTGPFVWQVTYWTIPLLFDTLTFLLTAWKAHSFWRKQMDTPLFNVIWHDGLLYFFAVFTMNVINVVFFLVAPSGVHTINLAATIMLEVILSCRLILNLRGTHTQSNLAPNLLQMNKSTRLPSKSSKWSSSGGPRPSATQSERSGANLEMYGKMPESNESVFNVQAIQRV